MATVARGTTSERPAGRAAQSLPTVLFVVAAAIILGACATNAAIGHWTHQPNRDLFQHMAALRALIADVGHPANPFVNSAETSRHFHPYWVTMAALARGFGWTMQTTLAVAGFTSLSVLALGYYLFGRSYFRSDWGPLALLLTSMLAWSFPISHTGYVNIPTLVEGAAYPAALLVGLSLVLWALVIESLRRPRIIIAIPFLAAFMFATHQLGAGLGFIVALCLIATWPADGMRRRWLMCLAIAGGVALSSLWPYFNPIEAVIRAGNPNWRGGIEWYTPVFLMGMFAPSAIGILGLIHPYRTGTGRPLLIALPILLGGFAAGAFGFMTGTRFAPTAVLLLQIGLAAILVRYLEKPEGHGERFRKIAVGTIFGALLFQFITLGLILYPKEARGQRRYGNVVTAGGMLTDDISDKLEVAAYDVAAWPLVGQGQRALSVPWPEPFIGDLADRQRKVDDLFNVWISRSDRVALARKYGVRTLILDQRFGPGKPWRNWQLKILISQAKASEHSGPMWRFDLY
jgi:hypothetical protein